MYKLSQLKNLGTTPTYFGLGMIQINLSPTVRLNFYHPSLQVSADPEVEFHDHRYDFSSRILIGQLVQKYVYFAPTKENATHVMKTVSCDKDNPAPDTETLGQIFPYRETTSFADSSYNINSNTFHSVHTAGKPCLTQIFRPAKATKKFANVIAPIGHATTCPFVTDLSTDECWGVIKDVLDSDR